MPSTAGHMIAPPMPISARQPTSHQMSGATAPSSENSEKMPAPTKNSRRRP